jgi:hypothetical protein
MVCLFPLRRRAKAGYFDETYRTDMAPLRLIYSSESIGGKRSQPQLPQHNVSAQRGEVRLTRKLGGDFQ